VCVRAPPPPHIYLVAQLVGRFSHPIQAPSRLSPSLSPFGRLLSSALRAPPRVLPDQALPAKLVLSPFCACAGALDDEVPLEQSAAFLQALSRVALLFSLRLTVFVCSCKVQGARVLLPPQGGGCDNMCACMCLCVCVHAVWWWVVGCVCICVFVHACMHACLCVCVCVRARVYS